MDKMNIKILDDGTISVKTKEISKEEHISADEFLELIKKLSGGKAESIPVKKSYSFSLLNKDRQLKTFQK